MNVHLDNRRLGTRHRCSICKLPTDTVAEINRMICEGRSYSQIARDTGLARSTLHRHAQACFTRASRELKARDAALAEELQRTVAQVLRVDPGARLRPMPLARLGCQARRLLPLLSGSRTIADVEAHAPHGGPNHREEAWSARVLSPALDAVLGALQPYPEAESAVRNALADLASIEGEPQTPCPGIPDW